VLFRGSANPRLEKFDPVTGASIEVLFQNTEDFGSVEFFPN
jgi:hypothetical protein